MELHEYSTEDLRDELRRRRYEKNGDWYFVYTDEDEDDPEWRSEHPNFLIVNRRTYHLQHKLQETQISHLLKLPKGFQEHRASHFEYVSPRRHRGVDQIEEALKLLQRYGFKRLNRPVLGDSALLSHHFKMSDKKPKQYEIKWHVESEQLKQALDTFLLGNRWAMHVKLVEYMDECRRFAETQGCVAVFFNIYENGCEAAFLPEATFHMLPKNPYNRREGEE